VRLSHRYIPARQLPDKSVSLLDTAAARVAISQHTVPPALDDCRRRIERLEIEQAIIGREIAVGIDADARAARVADALVHEHAALAELEARWEEERPLVDRILYLRGRLREEGAAKRPGFENEPAATMAMLDELRELQPGLDRQG
jgi:type VI secretion system protein VasG